MIDDDLTEENWTFEMDPWPDMGSGPPMPTLARFLLARIAEDAAVAQDQLRAYQHVFGIPHYFRIDRIVGLTPRMALAECEAKRRIVASVIDPTVMCEVSDDVLRALALPYADHPDYRDQWRPERLR